MAEDSEVELRVIVEVGDEGEAHGPLLTINGRSWACLTILNPDSEPAVIPEYVCVSYIWGSERATNPVHVGPQLISTNTLPALAAAMRNSDCKAFWIDAFCIPTIQPARRAALESMGFIYSQAIEVRVVLSETSFLAVQQLSSGDRLDEEALATLNRDEWVRSVWTYQEVVNSQRLAFVCPEAPGTIVDGSHFLNGIGFSLQTYKKSHDLDALAMRARFPSLDALEDLIADWMIAGYTERSALAVMSNMDQRVWTRERNYFYSMIGAVTSKPCRRAEVEAIHLSEVFMRICEEKSDFSFIYSSSTRSLQPRRRWRPGTGLLPSILPWHCWGELQPGHFDDSGTLWLRGMLQFQESPVSYEAREHIAKWLHTEDLTEVEEGELAEHAHTALIGMGFKGSKEYIALRDGLFFPQNVLRSGVEIDVLVSTSIRWTLGAPAISRVVHDGLTTYIPGVFFGIVEPQSASSVRLA